MSVYIAAMYGFFRRAAKFSTANCDGSHRSPIAARKLSGTQHAFAVRRAMTARNERRKTMALDHPGTASWLELIQAEYREMPGLSLKKVQMQRLWGLDARVCDTLVDTLVSTRVLRRTFSGNYVVSSRD
jgi:hypothetical protein